MTEQTRNRLQNDARRTQLLELGLRLFSTRSYEEVSIDEIARQASVSKGLLYHYFGGKRAFYVACVRIAAEQLLQTTLPPDDIKPSERAKVGLEAYLDFVEQRADAFSALMHGGLGADEEILHIIKEARNTIVERMIVGMGLETPRPVFRMAARSWIASVEALSLDWLTLGEPNREQLVAYLLGSLYTSMLVARQLDPTVEFEPDPHVTAQLLQLFSAV